MVNIKPDEIEKWISEWEGQTQDFKSYRILSHAYDLAELMVAFGNNRFVSEDFGGRIIIGVNNKTRKIEKFKAKQGHEETIMNIARDRCYPSVIPTFQEVSVDEKSVYVITIPKMTETPYQLITKEGKTFRIRVGSTIREPTQNELEALFDKSFGKSSDEKLALMLSSFSEPNFAMRQITIIPIDANSKLINFDRKTTEIFGITQPIYARSDRVKLKQNELHYEGQSSHFANYGILNDLGVYSLREIIKEQEKLINAGREVVFLVGVFENILKIYRQINYKQRISIHYWLHNVDNYKLGTEDAIDPINYEGYTAQKSDIKINRIINLSSLNIVTLVESILEELTRACGGAIDEGEYSSFVEKLSNQYFPKYSK